MVIEKPGGEDMQPGDQLVRRHVDIPRAVDLVAELLGIDTAAAAQAVALADWVYLDAGEVLFDRGDPSDAGFLVVRGRLAAWADDRAIGEIARGEIVGELGMLERSPRMATVIAMRDSALVRFDRDAFEHLTATHPTIMIQLARTIVRRLGEAGETSDRARNVAVGVTAPVDARRLVAVIADELRRFGTTEHLWPARVDADLGRPGLTADEPPDAVPALAAYIDQAETSHDYLVLELDPEGTRWTRRGVTVGDRVVVVMSASPSPDELVRADKILAAGPRRARVERWLALLHPAGTERPAQTPALVDRVGVDRVLHLREGRDADIRRLARLVSGNATGLVLGGGGARGFAHLGVWQALEELEVEVDALAGASIGTAVGALMAEQTPAQELVPLVKELFHDLLDYTVPVVSLIKGERVTRSINRMFRGVDILDLWLPFLCVSTNLTRSQVTVHDRGDVPTAMRASVAIPGILPPVPYDGELLVDGGVLNNLPCDVLRATRTVGRLIAVDLSPPAGPTAKDDFGLSVSGWKALRSRIGSKGSPYPGLMAILMRSMVTGSVRDRDRILSGGSVDCHLDLDLPGVSLLDFERVEEVAARGYADARPRLEAWLEER